MSERTLDQAMGMNDTEIAELRARVERLGAQRLRQDGRLVDLAQLRAGVAQQGLADRSVLVRPDRAQNDSSGPAAHLALESDDTVSHAVEGAS